MNPGDYLIALKRRWIDIVLAVGVALLAGWFITTTVAPPQAQTTQYKATAVLVSTQQVYTPGVANLNALATLTTVGQVPERAARALDSDLQPYQLAQTVKASANVDTGILRITAFGTDGRETAHVANIFAQEVIGFLQDQRAGVSSSEGGSLQDRLKELERQIDDLDNRSGDDPVLTAQRDALVRQYGLLYEQYRQVALQATGDPGVQIIQEAIPQIVPQTGFQVPQGRLSRMIIAGILGLFSGIVLVLVLDRFDNRIRNRKDAEERFRKPVIAEIPLLPRRRRKALELAPITHPRSPTADAFRMLSTMVSVALPSTNGDVGNGQGRPHTDPPRLIVITSPGPGDGKTTIAAGLAASLTARGKRVLILSCDFRRPRIHRIYGVSNDHGLAQALETAVSSNAGPGRLVEDLVTATKVPGVFLVPSGPPPDRPGELLSSPQMRQAIAEAKKLADVVIVDSAPILTTSDSTGLLEQADAVILVARAGRTNGQIAERTSEILERLGTPVAGVALNGATEIASPGRYYNYRYSTRKDRRSTRKDRRSKGFPRLSRHKEKV